MPALKVEAYRQMGEMLEDGAQYRLHVTAVSQSEPPEGHGGSQSNHRRWPIWHYQKESHIAQRLAKLSSGV